MINRHNRHYPGLRADFLPVVMESDAGVTLRMLVERDPAVKYEPVDEEESRLNAILLKSADPAVNTGGKIVLGKHLRDDLDGKSFICTGQTSLLDHDPTGSGEWVDYAVWVFYVDHDGVPQAPINRHLESYLSKASAPRLSALVGQWSAMQVFVPFKSDDVKNCAKSVCVGPLGTITNLTFDEEASTDDVLAGSARKFLPSLMLTAPESIPADSAAEIAVTLTDSEGNREPGGDAEVYLETTGGHLNRQRVQTQGGTATFKLRTLDLDKGDEVRVKAGFRNYSGIVEAVIKVA